jgi:hypothetical protein
MRLCYVLLRSEKCRVFCPIGKRHNQLEFNPTSKIEGHAFKLLTDSLGKKFNLPGLATTQEFSVGVHAARASIFSAVKANIRIVFV